MPNADAPDLSGFYRDLQGACVAGNHKKVINLTDKILSKKGSDPFALQCKLVALIKLEKYDEVMVACKKVSSFNDSLYFMKAYAEYRLNRYQNALDTLSKASPEDLKIQELKAQIFYRTERFSDAYRILVDIMRNSADDFADERVANITACAASAACWDSETCDCLDELPDAMHETLFNKACYYVGHKNYSAALKLLDGAEELCVKTLKDDPEITQEEIDEELAPILAQKAYILQRQSQEVEASKLYHTASKKSASDAALGAVVSNNIVCLNREHNIFDSRKRMKLFTSDSLKTKLFSNQLTSMAINQALFFWHSGQFDLCQAKVKALLMQDPHSLTANLISAALLIREKKVSEGIQLVKKLLEDQADSDEKDPAIPFTLLQLTLIPPGSLVACLSASTSGVVQHTLNLKSTQPLLNAANTPLLADVLTPDHLPAEVLYSPAVLSLRLAPLCFAPVDAAQKRKLLKVIQETVDWHRGQEARDGFVYLLNKLVDLLMRHGLAGEAAEYLEELLHLFDGNAMTAGMLDPKLAGQPAVQVRQSLLARLISAYAQFDREKAERCSEALQFDDELSQEAVDALETAFLFGAKYVKRLNRHADNKATDEALSGVASAKIEKADEARQKKKKRKTRLPKNCIPGQLPDPERWIPKRERTTFRKKGRDKRHGNLRGPQGCTSGASEWDANQRKFTNNSDAQSSGPAVKSMSAGARAQQRKGRKKGR